MARNRDTVGGGRYQQKTASPEKIIVPVRTGHKQSRSEKVGEMQRTIWSGVGGGLNAPAGDKPR